jgi:hypothetical protein
MESKQKTPRPSEGIHDELNCHCQKQEKTMPLAMSHGSTAKLQHQGAYIAVETLP